MAVTGLSVDSVVKINRRNKHANRTNTNSETAEKVVHSVVKQIGKQVGAKNERQQI